MNKIRPDFNRITTTLKNQEPDRVPLAEVAIDYKIMSQYLGREVRDDDVAAQVEFWTQAGYDYILLTVGLMRPGGVTQDSQISKVIQKSLVEEQKEQDEEAWNVWKKARIHSPADLESFPWEKAAILDFSKFYEVQQFLPEGMKIIAASGKIFTLTWMLMGFENFGVSLKLDSAFTREVIERVAKIQLDGLRKVVSLPNVAAVWAVDDIAFRTGPIIHPRELRKYIFPWYEEFSRVCHEHGLYFFFHTDGIVWDFIEDLIALGVDALHPIDPTCMDIFSLKHKVGSRLTLIGNISNQLLEEGTPDEVAALTKQLLREVAPGGGYCLGSGNSVPDWAKIENYKAMIETVFQYGYYPINIPDSNKFEY
jgi:uroporphyrinogen decarboxylase